MFFIMDKLNSLLRLGLLFLSLGSFRFLLVFAMLMVGFIFRLRCEILPVRLYEAWFKKYTFRVRVFPPMNWRAMRF